MFGKKFSDEKKLVRHPVLLDRKDVGLIVIDMQEKFIPAIYLREFCRWCGNGWLCTAMNSRSIGSWRRNSNRLTR